VVRPAVRLIHHLSKSYTFNFVKQLSVEYVHQLLDTLGEKGREAYLWNQIPLDMLYPGLFGASYALILAYLLQKLQKLESAWFFLC
jgi:hypothetical protein